MKNGNLGRDIKRALASGKLQQTESGVIIPGAQVEARGEYFHTVNGEDLQIDHNLLTTQFLNYLLMCGLHTQGKINNWYLALFGGNVTPAVNWTAATFTAAASELVSGTEGYSQANRPLFNGTAAAGNQIDNLTGGKAAFTIVTATQLIVRGAALLSDQLKGSTNGVLASASRFAADRTLSNGDNFELGYRVTLNAV